MDAKLARGYAREGRRIDQQMHDLVALGHRVVDEAAGLEIKVRRKISTRRLMQLAETSARLRHNVAFLRMGQALAGWGSSTRVQIAGSFFPKVVWFDGHLEKASQYQIDVTILSRRSYDRRREAKVFFIREHAIKRYIERSNAKYDDMFADLWPAVLLPTLLKMVSADLHQQIALPVKDGLFLGTYSGTSNDGISVVHRTGHARGRPFNDFKVHAPNEPATWVHTYISFDEMRDQQVALWLTLKRFLEEVAESMIDWHALGPLTFAFHDDPLNIWPNIACPDGVLRQFRRIYAGNVWRKALGRHHRLGKRPRSDWPAGPGQVALPSSAWAIDLPSRWSRRAPPRLIPLTGMSGVHQPR